MSFSTNDIQMGADLVIKAIGEDVQGFLKDTTSETERQSSAADSNRARESLRALSRWQLEKDILVMSPGDRTYSIDPAAIDSLSDEQVQKGGALYKDTVDTHMPIVGDLHRAGKADYVAYFGENHRSVDGFIEPPVSRPTEASMDTVAKSALAFVEAVDTDPRKGADLTGVTRMDADTLTQSLAEAGYLVPGENPNRTQSLAEQTARGSYEQKLAIFEQAAAISANVDVPDTMRGFDGPMLAAKGLKTAVDEAEIQEVPVFGTGMRNGASLDSDLDVESVKAITMTMLVAAKVVQNSQISSQIEDNDTEEPLVVVKQEFSTVDAEGNSTKRNDLLATLKAHIQHDEETGIIDVINRGANPRTAHDFYVPDLASSARETSDVAQTLAGFYKAAKRLANYEHDDGERIDADAGARGLGGPHSAWEGSEAEGGDSSIGEFDREVDLDEGEAEADEGAALGSNQKAELATERFAKAQGLDLDPIEMKVPEKLVDNIADKLEEAGARGLLQRMGKMTGRDEIHGENDAAIFSGNRAASFGGYEDFMSNALAPDASEKSFERDVYSYGQVSRRGPDFEENLFKNGAVRIDADRGFLKGAGYKSGAASSADKRVDSYVRDHMNNEDGTPNFTLRNTLRKISDRPVVAPTQEEAQAWKNQGQAFVERENAEHKLRLEAASAKAGVWSVDMSRHALQRAITVAQASGNVDTPFHLKIEKTGISMARPDTPMITAPMSANAPESITGAKTERTLGGMIAPAAIRGALEAMEKGETRARLVMHGEVPKGVTSEYAENRQRELEAAKAAKPKGLEPHLPDMLG